jgi:hypothetical protein
MQRWYFPQWSGDFRLEADGDKSKLVLEGATVGELEQLAAFVKDAAKRKWLKKAELKTDTVIELKASVAEAGKALLKILRPSASVLTAIKMVDGKLSVADNAGGEMSEAAIDAIIGQEASAAVSVNRPTPCCPDCVPGSIERASEVLLSFLTPEQHEAWAKNRQIVVVGHLSGHQYLLSHRHHPRAVRDSRMCFDLDKGYVLKFHDWGVPPEEEVLAAKLILEHREPWLRNEATLAHVWTESTEPLFKNPFGNMSDGVQDAAFTAGLGATFQSRLL